MQLSRPGISAKSVSEKFFLIYFTAAGSLLDGWCRNLVLVNGSSKVLIDRQSGKTEGNVDFFFPDFDRSDRTISALLSILKTGKQI